ncbi:C1 family peptidase [Persicobacter psychrovividus]|uniref:Peptidase C1A papain C-terminal domain-containing protein n=1 Tax=Persicobacter psychrovividus TaxID=387638 RepID=A0ABM7VKV0_9BACT|nr:hypothetical protein PEPS_39120 [Persicobacter psychrovividus]
MPIRMRKDPDQPNRGNGGGNYRGGRGGGWGGIISMLLPLLLRNPKLLIVAAIIFGAIYFFGGRETAINVASAVFSKGATLDPKQFDRAKIYEPIINDPQNPLPVRVSLEQFSPTRLNQGQQGSCVAWASAYGARTILESSATGQAPDDVRFSPSFLYNQIKLEGCQGSYIIRAMEKMTQQGAVPFSEFGYNEEDCSNMPSAGLVEAASAYKMKGFNRLTVGDNVQKIDLNAIRQNLAQGAPVVIGMMVGGSFMQSMKGQKFWQPTQADYQMRGFGGHAMTVIGYDDQMNGGAFQIMNSWGEDWGQDGLAWVGYQDFMHFTREAYAVFPMGRSIDNPEKFSFQIGLFDQQNNKYLPMKQIGNGIFESRDRLSPGSLFKVEVTNNLNCYTYIFGEETDGSSYVLFPYTEKHSAYCGIVGTRLFPRDYSMELDSLGHRDKMAVVVSKQALDYKKLNEAINNNTADSYAEKFKKVLQTELIQQVKYVDGLHVEAEATKASKNTMLLIMEIQKQ